MFPIALTHASAPNRGLGPFAPVGLLEAAGQPTIPANAFAIVNDVNMTAAHLGSGVHSIVKTGGAAGTYDAGAVSQASVSGDFILRLEPVTTVGTGFYGGGLNDAPTASQGLGDIDFLFAYSLDFGSWLIFENGVQITGSVIPNATYAWVWRFGTTISYGRGATFAAAQASVERTTTSSATLYFDSTSQVAGSSLKALFYLPQDIAATSAMSFVASGAETANGTLAGASPLIFAPTAQLLGAITAVGTSLLTFTPAAAETATGGLTGTTSLTFAPSGAETARGTLVGTTAGIFTSSVAESAGGALAGSATLVFTPSAPGTAKATLAGTAAVTFGQSSSVTASGSLVGTAALTFTPSGAETAKGTLVSTSALTFSGSGIASVSLTQIAGSVSVSFSSAGNVLAFASLAGSGGFSFAGAGAVVLDPAWHGSSAPDAVTLTPTADPSATVLTIDSAPSATPLAVSRSPTAGTFLQDNDPVQLEWSA